METIENGKRVLKLYAECKKGVSFKFYQVMLKEQEDGKASLDVTYGRIGAKGSNKHYGTYRSWAYGQEAADGVFERKLRKGYKAVSALEALASSCETPEDRLEAAKRQPIQIDLPTWNTGSKATDRRLEKLAQTTLEKLNLTYVDKDKFAKHWAFSTGPRGKYRDEINRVLDGFRTSYYRVSASDTHAVFCGNEVEDKARAFFSSLNKKFEAGLNFWRSF